MIYLDPEGTPETELVDWASMVELFGGVTVMTEVSL